MRLQARTLERSRTKADTERSSSLFPHNPSDPKKAKSLRQTCLAFSYLKEISRANQVCGVPYGSRTRVAAVKGRCPRPLDERDADGGNLHASASPFGWGMDLRVQHVPP